jgi:hypothetical protein
MKYWKTVVDSSYEYILKNIGTVEQKYVYAQLGTVFGLSL